MSFQFSEKKKPLAIETRLKSGRKIMLDGISNQISAIQNPEFTVKRYRYYDHHNDDGSTTRKRTEIAVRPRRWWWIEQDDIHYLELRYGATVIFEVEDGKTSIVCGDDIDSVLLALQNAKHHIEKGFWDDRIAEYKERSRRNKT